MPLLGFFGSKTDCDQRIKELADRFQPKVGAPAQGQIAERLKKRGRIRASDHLTPPDRSPKMVRPEKRSRV
jgi:hypothetical protein